MVDYLIGVDGGGSGTRALLHPIHGEGAGTGNAGPSALQQGIPQAGWDNDWLYAFLGLLLLGAVLVNNWVKTRAESLR